MKRHDRRGGGRATDRSDDCLVQQHISRLALVVLRTKYLAATPPAVQIALISFRAGAMP